MADPAEVAEGVRLQRELDHFAGLRDKQGTLGVTERINDLVMEDDKYALREQLIMDDFIRSVSEALVRLWPSQQEIDNDDTEAFEAVSGLLVWFCQENQQYDLKNRVKFANDCAKVMIAGLVLPEQQATTLDSAWGEIFQYIDHKVLKEAINTVTDVCRSNVDEGMLDSLNDKVDQARIGKGAFTWLDGWVDMFFAPLGLYFDLSQFPGFISKGDYLSLVILLAANIIRGLAAGFLCSDIDMYVVPKRLHSVLGDTEKAGEIFYKVHNFFTFGVSGLMLQIWKAYQCRVKNNDIVRMRMFDAMKSSVSLIITGLSILDNRWYGFEVKQKCCCLLYSVYSISKAAYKAHKGTIYDYQHYLKHSTHKSNVVRKTIRQWNANPWTLIDPLRIFHVSEVLGIFVFLPAERIVSYSLLCILGVELAVLVAGIFLYTEGRDERGVGHERWKLSFFATTYMWANPLLGVDNDKIAFNQFVVFVRPIPWLVAWCLVLGSGGTTSIPEHAQLTATIYLFMAAAGVVMYAVTATFFYRLGLWLHNEDTGGE